MGIRKTEYANEERYAKMGRKRRPDAPQGERRLIATGTLVIESGRVTHYSDASIGVD